MTVGASPDRHPVLLNAMYLWSCFVSRPGPLSHHENHYLARALESLDEGLQDQGRVIDVIQASCLLSLYFLANGRLLEGSYHVSGAASMCVQWGLHGGISNAPVLGLADNLPSFKLPPPIDPVEAGERILTFWQVYNLDRCWSVVLQRPPTIPDGQTASMSINTPWPLDIEEYESVCCIFSILLVVLSDHRVMSMMVGRSRQCKLSLKAKDLTSSAGSLH